MTPKASTTEPTAAERLRNAGIRATPVRQWVLAALADGGGVSPAEMLERLAEEGVRINKVTLYRTLDLFVERGVAERHAGAAPTDRSFRYCVATPQGHCHFYCTVCGSMQCLHAPVDLSPLIREIRAAGGTVHAADVRLEGVCGRCATS